MLKPLQKKLALSKYSSLFCRIINEEEREDGIYVKDEGRGMRGRDEGTGGTRRGIRGQR